MRAIRVLKRNGSGSCFHWLLDEGRTLCGRDTERLDVDATLDLEVLPSVEACRACERARGDFDATVLGRSVREPIKTTLAPSLGTLRTGGSLSHGVRRRFGRRLT